MNRRQLAGFSALTIAVALLAFLSVAYRIVVAEAEGRREARADFEQVTAILSRIGGIQDLADGEFRAKLALHYRDSPRLLLVGIYEPGTGIRWRLPASSSYLPAVNNQKPIPVPDYPRVSTLLMDVALPGDRSGKARVEALYVTLSQSAVFVALRDAAIALTSYLALSSIYLAVALRRRAKDEESAADSPESAANSPQAELPSSAPAEPIVDGRRIENEQNLSESSFAGSGLDDSFHLGPSAEEAYASPAEEFEIPDIVEDEGETDASLPELPKVRPAASGHGSASGPKAVAARRPSPTLEDLPSLEAVPEADEAFPRGLYSPESGLGWESYLGERLDAELSRSASFEQDLSLLLVSYDGLSPISPAYLVVAKAIVDFFGFRDLAYERGPDGFAVILSNVDADHALRRSEEFLKKLTFLLRDFRQPLEFLPLFMGLSSRAGRLVDGGRMLEEAIAALAKAREDRDSHIVAFRPDPDKFRSFLTSKRQG
jgi:GGDEF domain-containing protein